MDNQKTNPTALRPSEDKASERTSGQRKRPYSKPAFVYRAPLEAMAAVCLPHPPGKAPGACTTGFS